MPPIVRLQAQPCPRQVLNPSQPQAPPIVVCVKGFEHVHKRSSAVPGRSRQRCLFRFVRFGKSGLSWAWFQRKTRIPAGNRDALDLR